MIFFSSCDCLDNKVGAWIKNILTYFYKLYCQLFESEEKCAKLNLINIFWMYQFTDLGS